MLSSTSIGFPASEGLPDDAAVEFENLGNDNLETFVELHGPLITFACPVVTLGAMLVLELSVSFGGRHR